MPGISHEHLQEPSEPYVTMKIKCATCAQEMLVQVGLTLVNGSSKSVSCLHCHNALVPLIPGPIVGGPFAV